MNANELADIVDRWVEKESAEYLTDAATMLRQQQAEIEALKQSKSDGNNKVNSEPVAWINLDRFKDEALYLADCVSENKVDNMGITTPLYTHPAKTLTDDPLVNFKPVWQEKPELTLTDEEIYFLAEEYNLKWSGYMDLVIRFARAILRKAQEK